MVNLDALKLFTPDQGRHQIPLSKVSTVAFFCSANVPVRLTLVDPDGELRPCGQIPPHSLELHKLELRNFVGLYLEALPDHETDDWYFNLHLDVRHSVGEPVSDIPLKTAVSTPRQISERERTRRTVLQTLQTLNVMPDDDQLTALEASLGFDFEADEFGDYLEQPPLLVDDQDELPVDDDKQSSSSTSSQAKAKPKGSPPEDPPQEDPPQSSS